MIEYPPRWYEKYTIGPSRPALFFFFHSLPSSLFSPPLLRHNPQRIARGIEEKAANAMMVKVPIAFD